MAVRNRYEQDKTGMILLNTASPGGKPKRNRCGNDFELQDFLVEEAEIVVQDKNQRLCDASL